MHLKMNNVDYLKKPSYFFIHIFAIKKSSRHEKRSHILARLFWLFQCSGKPRNSQWSVSSKTSPYIK